MSIDLFGLTVSEVLVCGKLVPLLWQKHHGVRECQRKTLKPGNKDRDRKGPGTKNIFPRQAFYKQTPPSTFCYFPRPSYYAFITGLIH